MGRDPQYLAFMRAVEQAIAANETTTVEQERADHRSAMAQVPTSPLALEQDLKVAGLRARLYHPAPGTILPGLVFFHGGGFYLGDVESYDPVVRELVKATGCAMVSVDHRLAPEHPFPAAVDDAVAATTDVVGRAEELGIDANRVGVAGDSSGANLAAVAAIKLRGRVPLALQLLVYGVYDLTDEPVRPPDPDGLVLGGVPFHELRERYLAGSDPAHPDASPMLTEDLSGLPPAVIVVAEYDRLREQGVRYAERLRAAGVPVSFVSGTGLDHAFVAWGAFASRPADAIAELGASVRNALQG
jgi:acetyl esterase